MNRLPDIWKGEFAMYETCTVCNRFFYSRDYPPRLCPICEEEAISSGESAFYLATRGGQAARPERRA
jgi:hypothetical protein